MRYVCRGGNWVRRILREKALREEGMEDCKEMAGRGWGWEWGGMPPTVEPCIPRGISETLALSCLCREENLKAKPKASVWQ